MHWIDLRSDTVTQPTPAMREAMARADVGDDVYGEDPTVNALQQRLASELGFEAGLFVPSGTQSNLLALMSHCARGDEYLVGMEAHTYKFEGGGAAVLGSIHPQPIPQLDDGTIALDAIELAIKPDDSHFARTRLLCLEDTWRGRPLPLDYLDAARKLTHARGLGFHLDGARLFNAAIAQGVPASTIARKFDSVSVCCSKGLGAPVGSVLLGSHEFIHRAARWRKMVGGGWRQAGVLAAACLHGLDHNVERLAEDHARAARLADALQDLSGLTVRSQHTNMVFIDVPAERRAAFKAHMDAAHVRMAIGYVPLIRMVVHLHVDDADIERTVEAFRSFFA
jgi:threonine aldolase